MSEGPWDASEVVEPMRRNSVVVLNDGSIARRNVEGPTSEPLSGGPWTHYPAKPIHERTRTWTMDAIDPGWTVTWDQLKVDRVLYVPGQEVE